MFYVWGSEWIPRYYAFSDVNGWGIDRHARGTSLPVLLNTSCHKKHEYIWFMGGDLNVVLDINLLMM